MRGAGRVLAVPCCLGAEIGQALQGALGRCGGRGQMRGPLRGAGTDAGASAAQWDGQTREKTYPEALGGRAAPGAGFSAKKMGASGEPLDLSGNPSGKGKVTTRSHSVRGPTGQLRLSERRSRRSANVSSIRGAKRFDYQESLVFVCRKRCSAMNIGLRDSSAARRPVLYIAGRTLYCFAAARAIVRGQPPHWPSSVQRRSTSHGGKDRGPARA